MDVDIGGRLRAERERRGLSLRELAARVGVSASMMSQVETGRSRASVSTLYAVVSELGLSLDDLFALGPDRAAAPRAPAVRARPVLRAEDRARIELETGVVWERLANIDPDVLQLMEVTYPPGGKSSRSGRFSQHAGVDCGYVLAGRLTLRLGFETPVLGPGDVTLFDAAEPHLLENTGTEEARAIWFIHRGDTPLAEEGNPRREGS